MSSPPCQLCGSAEGPEHLCPGESLRLIGQVLDGRYRVDDVVGHGGMGMVFRATQTSVQREVAVKVLHPMLATAPQFFERFRREAETASRLKHPNIITVFDFGRTPEGICYYVMELLEGDSLKQLVKREGPLPLGRAVEIILQAARALGHAHQMGAVHRDLKPANMMVRTLDGRDFVKVLDFGLVKALEQDENDQLTSTGQVLGTPQYMPPEQAGGEQVDERSDLYSLGGCLHFCLTGSSPFGANTVRKALQAGLTQNLPPVAKKRRGAPVPSEVDELLRKALAREKEDRYQSADELVADLQMAVAGLSLAELQAVPQPPEPSSKEGSGSGSRAQAGGTIAARRQAPQSRSRPASNVLVDPAITHPPAQDPAPASPAVRKGLFAAAGLLGLTALAMVGYLAWGPETPPPVPLATSPLSAIAAPTLPIAQPPDLEPVRAPVDVELSTLPPGAGIYDGEVQLGTTPTALRLERGRVHHLSFRLQGHTPAERAFDLSRTAGDKMAVTVELSKLPSLPQPPSQGSGRKPQVVIPVFE